MTRSLKVGKTLSLPLSWMQLASVVYGARGSGKTVWGSVMAEEITEHKQRFVAIDPKGDWYGLRSTADGKSEGIPVVIFGGDHADLPLEDGAGKWLGETVAKLDQSVILDLEHLSKTKQRRLVADFFEALYHHNREPLAVFLDEAQRFAPQGGGRGIDPEVARCLGAVEDLIKMGRKHGIGPVLVTQRGSSLNKEVSELCDLLVAFRTPGPLDQDRVKDWLDANTTKAQRDEVMGLLAGLETGTAVFASGHPKLKVFGVHDVRMRWTFDSSATPEIGKPRKEPKKLAEPDLDELRREMDTAIKRIEAEDPRKLRLRVVELEKQIQKYMMDKQERANAKLPPSRNVEIQVPFVDETALGELNKKLQEALGGVHRATSDAQQALKQHFNGYVQRSKAAAKNIARARETKPAVHETIRPVRDTIRSPAPSNGALSTPADPSVGTGGLRRILIALAQRPQGLNHRQLGLRSVLSSRSGTFATYLGRARANDWVEGRDKLTITKAGLAALGRFEPLPEGRELLDFWLRELGQSGQARMLRALAEAYPRELTNDELGEAAGISSRSGTFATYLGRLRGLELVDGRAGSLRASEEFFT